MFAKGCITQENLYFLKQMDAKHAEIVFVFERKDSVNGAGSVNSFEWWEASFSTWNISRPHILYKWLFLPGEVCGDFFFF